MVWYTTGTHLFIDGAAANTEPPFQFSSDIVRVALMLTTYVFAHTHLDFADVSASEVTVTNYTARGNGIQLANKVSNLDLPNTRSEWDADDLAYNSIGNGANQTFDQIIVLREPDAGATDGNSQLLAHSSAPSTLTNGGNVLLEWNVEGILHLITV